MGTSTRKREVDEIARFLRLAVSDWHSWLSGRVVDERQWRETPGWCRNIVRDLDLEWAMFGQEFWYMDAAYYRVLNQRVFALREWVRRADDDLVGMPEVERLWVKVSSFERHFKEEE